MYTHTYLPNTQNVSTYKHTYTNMHTPTYVHLYMHLQYTHYTLLCRRCHLCDNKMYSNHGLWLLIGGGAARRGAARRGAARRGQWSGRWKHAIVNMEIINTACLSRL